ncbi:phenylalanine--tRNA ligase beta subunit-related protein [Streptomyces sp. NBC_00080]|uniref:B3/B4 domain-containing protein n=1 Tax=Streptomyces sp. NBC_00080 TaxID=2975645 RepID=UPI003247D88E
MTTTSSDRAARRLPADRAVPPGFLGNVLPRQLADGTWQPADETDPRIEAWHTAYRSFGINPRRIRPSVDALGRRLAKKGTLPRINPAVDSYNAVSVRHALPAGAFDLDHATGDVDLRYADGTAEFTPLGEPGTTERPKAGEIIYTDTTDVLTRHWSRLNGARRPWPSAPLPARACGGSWAGRATDRRARPLDLVRSENPHAR